MIRVAKPGWCVLAIVAIGACADTPQHGKRDRFTPIRDAAQAALDSGQSKSYSIALWQEGEIVFAEAFGARNAQGDLATSSTLYQIGSDTKKITALAVLQAVQTGSVSLDSSVTSVLSDLQLATSPQHLDNTKLIDLMTHRTGLWDYTPWIDEPNDDTATQSIYGKFAANEYPMMPPGIAFNYSNPNFMLAGLIVEVLADRSWANVVSEDIFSPLGLTHTYARKADMLANKTDIASGHGLVFPDGHDTFDLFEQPDFRVDWVTPANQPDAAMLRPAGLVWSTATDQARLLGFLIDRDDNILSDALHTTMMEQHVDMSAHPIGLHYGFGLTTADSVVDSSGQNRPLRAVFHGGATLSMSSASVMLPELRLAVSVLTNSADNDSAERLAQVALETLIGDDMPAPIAAPAVLPPAADLSTYAGDFTDPNLGDVAIVHRDGKLTISIPTLNALDIDVAPTLTPLSLDVFSATVDGEPFIINFYNDARGVPTYGVNRLFVLTRSLE